MTLGLLEAPTSATKRRQQRAFIFTADTRSISSGLLASITDIKGNKVVRNEDKMPGAVKGPQTL